MSAAMTHRGVPYTLIPSAAPGFWNWQFQIDGTIMSGRVETRLELMAMRRVKTRIDRALRETSFREDSVSIRRQGQRRAIPRT
jgi:hypothetical protein